mgnify:CR=1 FL=1
MFLEKITKKNSHSIFTTNVGKFLHHFCIIFFVYKKSRKYIQVLHYNCKLLCVLSIFPRQIFYDKIILSENIILGENFSVKTFWPTTILKTTENTETKVTIKYQRKSKKEKLKKRSRTKICKKV